MSLKAIFIHSTGGDPDECWYPWLRTELEKLGIQVTIPRFPSPEGQNLDNWMDIFEPFIKDIDKDTIFVGRSIGPPFILRILERIQTPIKACFMIAGFISDLKLPEFAPYIDSFIEKPFCWDKIKNNCQSFYVYHGMDDPIVPLVYGEEFAEKLGVKPRVFSKAGHFNMDTRFAIEFPEILDDIKKLINVSDS